MDDSWRDSRELHERIRWARMHLTKFPRMIDAAESIPIRYGTYRTYEQSKADEGRVPPLTVIQKIAKKFGCSWQWLATGDGSPYDKDEPTPLMVVSNDLAKDLEEVPEEKREDAVRAMKGVLAAFKRTA